MPGKSGIRLTDRQRDSLVGRIYEAAADPLLWPDVLIDIGKPVRAHAAQLVTISDDPADVLDNILIGVDDGKATPEFEELVASGQHPRVSFGTTAPEMMTFYDYMHTSEDEMRSDKCYQEHFIPLAVPYYAATTLANKKGQYTLVGHFRKMRYGHFDMDEVAYLNQLASHLRRSIELGRRLPRQGALRGIEAILECLGCPAAVVDRRLTLVSANDRFLRLIDENEAISLQNQQLRLADSAAFVRLQRQVCLDVRAPHSGGIRRGGHIRLKQRSGQSNYELVVARLSSDLTLSKKGLCLVFAVSSKQSFEIDPDFIRREFSLTVAEADVAAMLANGHSIKTIARIRECRLETIRSHVKSILRKTGTTRQAELVALLLISYARHSVNAAVDPTRPQH